MLTFRYFIDCKCGVSWSHFCLLLLPQLEKLLLTPPNVPTGNDAHKDGVHSQRYGSRSLQLRAVRPLVKVSQS